MHYEIEFLPVAMAQLRALPKDIRRLIGGKIDRLQDDLETDVKNSRVSKTNTASGPEIIGCFLNWRVGQLWFMLWVTGRTFMSNTLAVSNKSRAAWSQLDKQLIQAKALLRQMRQTVEDVEDARTIEKAKSAHGNKPRIPWSQVKKEVGLD